MKIDEHTLIYALFTTGWLAMTSLAVEVLPEATTFGVLITPFIAFAGITVTLYFAYAALIFTRNAIIAGLSGRRRSK